MRSKTDALALHARRRVSPLEHNPTLALLTERIVATKYAERRRREVQAVGVGPHDKTK